MLRALLSATRSAKQDDPWDLAGRVAELESAHRAHCEQPDLLLVRRAYRIAEQMHRGQARKSGEPYITHPIAVATILADLGVDTATVAAGLLHDTVEDTSYSLEALRSDFGGEIAVMVDGVTKLDKIHLGSAAEAETFRKLVLTAGRDIRVMVIKLADRLHNMRTIKFKKRPSQIRIAEATRDVLIPLADRLGLYVIKRELEDIVLETLEPEIFQKIQEHIGSDTDRNRQVAAIVPQVRRALRGYKVNARLLDRPRHPYSVYREMQKHPGTGPADPPRLVVVVEGPPTECYAALGAIHQQWKPIGGKFRDLIATQKFNLYQSLHTAVNGPAGANVEFLIRTKEMHQTAEIGIVAGLSDPDSNPAEVQLPWLRRLLDWQHEVADSGQFLDSLRCDLADQDILVFAGDGDQVLVPKASTPVDVAYCTGPATGHRLIAAYVNGEIAPLSQALRDGDSVELVLTNEQPYGPSKQWLEHTKTPEAQLHINGWFDSAVDIDSTGELPVIPMQRFEDELKAGKNRLWRSLIARGRGLAGDRPLHNMASSLGFPDLDSLYLALAREKLDPDELAEKLITTVDRF
ncbi:RelA/SpoT family protein [Glycomyces buryatensis]|uniref:Bifunctional (P)ppGpp synthetase/guanosine-3',5'-bis(Diphosphate) 3'-pyrophosphohydrolase n=1 Tax=Glycomyces buryatensis TaxID=2570927 RepID=A0A4S8Q3A4_9ACTN|nr:HD domain-containing protein [Glycomyces buryatensis]THV38598.1 bifunctional (p)ppGpp synthetase/guanosine-3',5'-bis(diphosphate) 3'-pyrophosphohydrolase [Glycomyces buryatensis]